MSRPAALLMSLFLVFTTANVTAETLWTFSSSPNGFSSPSWARTATVVFSDGNRLVPPFLFEESLATLDSVGDEIVVVANAQTDPDFDYFAQLITNGIDDRLNIEIHWNGTSSSTFNSTFERIWFAGSPYSNGIDLHGSEISAIVLRIFDISDGAPNLSNGLELSYSISIEGTPPVDSDSDGIADVADNCRLHANPSQSDADGDGIGTRCDGDFNNDCVVNPADLGLMRANFFGTDHLYDLDNSGVINFGDLGLLGSLFFLPPGPSGLPNICLP